MADPNITEEVFFEMLEKKADGSFKAKFPKVKSKSGVTFDDHLADNVSESNPNNPHGISKSAIGLGSVLNYGIATQAEAEAGTSNVKYMTSLRVKESILANVKKIAIGQYTGTGASQNINVGFTPQLVLIYGSGSETNMIKRTGFIGPDGTGRNYYGGVRNNMIITNGFTAYHSTSSSYPNFSDSGALYTYIAMG